MIERTYTQARAELATLMDRAVDDRETVIIERRGVRFAVSPVVAPARARSPRTSRIEIVDPSIESGSWSWSWSPSTAAEFVTPPRRRRSARS